MNDSSRRSALAALDAARPAIARLDAKRDSEDVAADLIEGWSAVETALRSLVGGASLSGQALIREARQRQLIDFGEANALAEFNAARERVQRIDYRPSDADVAAARDGFLKLETSLMHGDVGPAGAAASAATAAAAANAARAAAVAPAPADTVVVNQTARTRRRMAMPLWAIISLVVVVLVVIAVIVYANEFSAAAQANKHVATGAQDYRAGQREAAVGEFNAAIQADPHNALAHVYLSRMAREAGNMPLANEQARDAVSADASSPDAQREMGSVLLASNSNQLAAKFYARAIGLDASDKASMGWLGCALIKQGQVALAQRWFQRAGPGPWSGCANMAPLVPNGQPAAPQP